MKQLFLFSLSLLCSTFILAQDCDNGWLPMQEGIKYELTSYNAKGKVLSVNKCHITAVKQTEQGTVATIAATASEGKSESNTMEMEFLCKGDVYEMDLNSSLEQMSKQMPEGVSVNVEGMKLKFPANMAVGDELEDTTITMTSSMGSMQLMKIDVTHEDRKVIGSEKITVPAGTFECLKISYTLKSAYGMGTKTMQVTDWIAKGVGSVRSETKRKGKLESYTELTAFEK